MLVVLQLLTFRCTPVVAVGINSTRRLAPQAAYAARYACSGNKNSMKRKGGHDFIVGESWRLENAKSRATILQENNRDATRMSIYRACTWYFVVFAMYTYACLEACDYRAFVACMTNRHGHWVCGTSACWMSMGGKNTAISSVEHVVVEVTVKRRLFLVTSVTPISTLKIVLRSIV